MERSMTQARRNQATWCYAICGAAFGVCFPVLAIILDLFFKGMPLAGSSVLQLYREQPLHWIIGTAPFFLGLFAALAGLRQDRVAGINEHLEELVRARTGSLEASNQSLCAQIAERERVELELRRAKSAAEEASRAKSVFLANMSHEIRTPMNGVLGMIELLRHSDIDEDQASYLDAAHESGRTLLAIISDILDLSKIEAGKLELEHMSFVPQKLVQDTVTLHRQAARMKNIDVELHCAPEIPEQLSGDPHRIRQVLGNLLSNAIKFTERGCVRVDLQSGEIDAQGAVLQFSVRDTGIGIAADAREHIFQSFAQADQSTTRRFGGTGLGLPIARHLAQMMGGDLWLEGSAAGGSTFCFTVRLGKA
jgi:two-component system, sensor histidine kinase